MKTSNSDQPRELGKVSWFRDFDEAVAESARSGKPVLLLFQEVPGCSNCVDFGRNMLTHPLFVEAIENEFVPLAIFNNVEGADKVVLQRFNEPAWNNPVVRFIRTDGADLVARFEFSLSAIAFHMQMRKAIAASGREMPRYFELLAGELKILSGTSQIAYYQTPCFWSGETSLIQHAMVLSTEAGWIAGEEVVKVHYDPEIGPLSELNRYAADQQFSFIEGDERSYRKDAEPQYYLKKSVFRFLPLGFTQRSWLNFAVAHNEDGKACLDPRQQQLLRMHAGDGGRGADVLYDRDMEDAWPWA